MMNPVLRQFALLWIGVGLYPQLHAQTATQTTAIQTTAIQTTAIQTTAPAPATTTAPDLDADETVLPDVASQVRIVRLSQVRGKVSIERSAGSGFTAAFANIPIVTGTRLRTQAGVAEVEFEDGSTLRLTPNSAVTFDQLGRSARGATISQLMVPDGSVYVSLARTRDNVVVLVSGKARMQLSPGTHLRLDASASATSVGSATSVATALSRPPDPSSAAPQVQQVSLPPTSEPNASVAVFDGEVDFSNPAGHRTLTRKHSLKFDSGGANAPVLAARVEQEPFDEWDKQGVQYQKRYHSAAFGGSAYGVSDLTYYGGFTNLAGCGSVWRPYFASAAWDPYDNGIWAWYGNAGYSWVSPYPWGWLPFHTGSWQFCGAGGWGWRPGGAFYGLQNRPGLFRPAIYGVKRPPQRPLPTAPGNPRLAAVNVHPLPVSTLTPSGDFLFHKDSAGFGVPREAFHHLGRESAAVDRRGLATKSLDVERFSLPSSNRMPAAGWAGSGRTDAGFPNRSAWAAAHPGAGAAEHPGAWAAVHPGEEPSRDRGAAAPGSAMRPAPPSAGWNSGPRGGGARNSGDGNGSGSSAMRTAPAGSSPAFHSAPAGPAPSFHSAPSASPAPAASPTAGAARGK